MEYYIFSFKHTNKKDKYFTLWRPNNKGYCYPLQAAGRYTELINGYHCNDYGENIAVPLNEIPSRFIELDQEGRECVKVSKASIEFIKLYQ